MKFFCSYKKKNANKNIEQRKKIAITCFVAFSYVILMAGLSNADQTGLNLNSNIYHAFVYSASYLKGSNIDVNYNQTPDGWATGKHGCFSSCTSPSGGSSKSCILAHRPSETLPTYAEYKINNSLNISTYFNLADLLTYKYWHARFVFQIILNNYITLFDSVVADSNYCRYLEYDFTHGLIIIISKEGLLT